MRNQHRDLFLLIPTLVADIANGVVFFAISNGHYALHIILGYLCFAAAVFSTLSFVLSQKGIKGPVYTVTTTICVFLNIPVAFYSVFWLLWALDLKLIPPPQR